MLAAINVTGYTMSRNIDDLRRSFRTPTRELIRGTSARGFAMVPYFTLRTPPTQAKLWRMTRGKTEIGNKVQHLLDRGALYIANVIESVGPQFPTDGVTGHVTNAVPGQSWHNWGEGLDCYLKIDGGIEWGEHEGYNVYGEVAEELGLMWGGNWSLKDFGHVQVRSMSPLSHFTSWIELSSALERKYGEN